ncbi:NUDIX hydrolase [Haloarcula marina]|uniref:NUDIX hydrolase n=1 Tax=Haloarcula marina TaxID=2961574 RepID=UPI0020B689F7|nr:NUDIX domain-containing protein [Halomicroarcula marina]
MDEQFLEATVSLRGAICAPDGRVLTIRRASDGGWELPGGRINDGEAVVEGLEREILEETGLTVQVHQPVHAVTWHNDRSQGRFAVYYHCTTNGTEGPDVTLSHEHTDWAWLPESDLRERLSTPQSTAVERALAAGSVARPSGD